MSELVELKSETKEEAKRGLWPLLKGHFPFYHQ